MVYPSQDLMLRPRKPINGRWSERYITNLYSNYGMTKPINIKENVSTRQKDLPNISISNYDCTRAKKEFHEYCITSTLHGLKYLGDGKLSWFERCFWLLALIMSFTCAVFFIMNIFDKWSTSPMIISVNPLSEKLKSIPFPAVTLCNVNQAKKSAARRIIKEGNIVDQKLLEGICTVNNQSALADIDSSIGAEWNYFQSFLINVTQPCSEMLMSCMWKSEIYNCENLFNAQLTDEGLCCTFNAVHRDLMFRNPNDISNLNLTFPFPAVDWTPEDGYPKDAPLDGVPWRPFGIGASAGLTLVLDAASPEYFCSTINAAGFKVLLYNPTETPKMSDFGFLISPGYDIRVVVLPRINDANPRVMNIPISKRQCVFAKERKLTYYRTYSENNCALECEAKLQLSVCNCSQYYLPRNRWTRICGKADTKCNLYVKKLIIEQQQEKITTDEMCLKCLPACSEISYSREFSFAKFNPNIGIHSDILSGKTNTYFKDNCAVLHIYFDVDSFTRYTKDEIFGFTEFLSSTGGLLGLCVGFSMISLVEIFYFLTFKVLCENKRRRPRVKQIHPYTN